MSKLSKQEKDKKFLIDELNYVKHLIDGHIETIEDSEEEDLEAYHLIMHSLRQIAGKAAFVLINQEVVGDMAEELVEMNLRHMLRSNTKAIEIVECY
jgi:uncharacterized protein YuzB (UPF0349 family)